MNTNSVAVFIFVDRYSDDFASIAYHPWLPPHIYTSNMLDPRETSTIDLRFGFRTCTLESKEALLEAIREWLQARYDEGDRTYDGLSAFIEQARIEYLQPMEDAP